MSFPVVLATDLMLNVRNVDRAQRDVEKAIGGGAAAGLTGAMNSTRKELTSGFSKVYIDAIKVGNKEQAAQIKAEYKQRADRVKSLGEQMAMLNDRIAASNSDADKRLFAARKDNLESLVNREQQAQKHMLEDRAAGMDHIVKLYDEGMEKSGRKFEDKAQGAAESFTDVVNKGLTLDSLNPDDLVRGIGKSLKKNAGSLVSGGKNMMAKGGKMAARGGAAGGAGKAMAMMGRLGAAVGAAAGVIAGVAVAIAAVVAIFAAAYGKVKEWNKAVLSSASGYDIMTGSLTTVDAALHTHRRMMSRVSRQWALSGEEVAALTGALHQQGLTFGEMKGWTNARNELTALSKAATFAVVQTKSLGISADELGTLTNRMYEGFGLGLKEMTEQMAKFGSSAQMAGMSTRSFVAAVMEATANMALYNFRLEDTSELLIGLTKILGEDLAKATAGMSGSFKDASFQENYKATITGGGALADVIDASATRQIEGTFADMTRGQQAFMKEQGLMKGDGEMRNPDGEVIRKSTIEIDYEKLGNLSGLEAGAIMNQLEEKGMGMDSFESLTDLAAGIGGDNSEKADALANLDRTGEIAASVAKALGVLTVKSLEEMSVGQRMAFEDISGIQGKDLAVFEAIYNRLGATMQEEDVGGKKYGKDGPNWAQISKAIAGGQVGVSQKDQEALDSLMPKQQLDVATQTLHATQTIGDVLKGKIAGALNWIGGGVTGVLGWFKRDNDETEETKQATKERKSASLSGKKLEMLIEEQRDLERDDTLAPGEKERKLERNAWRQERASLQMDAASDAAANIEGGMTSAESGEQKFYDLGNTARDLQHLVKGGVQDLAQEREMYPHAYRRGESSATSYAAQDGLGAEMGVEMVTLLSESWDPKEDLDSESGEEAAAQVTREGWSEAIKLLDQLRIDAFDEKEGLSVEKAVAQAAIASSAMGMSKTEKMKAQDLAKAGVKAGEGTKAEVQELADVMGDLLGSTDEQLLASALEDYNKDRPTALTRKEVMTPNTRGGFGHLTDIGLGGLLPEDVRLRLRAKRDSTSDDFIYRGDSFGGVITPINAADDLLGMKPGGAIDRVLGRGRGGGGIHTVNIYESGDPNKTLRMVTAALKAAGGVDT